MSTYMYMYIYMYVRSLMQILNVFYYCKAALLKLIKQIITRYSNVSHSLLRNIIHNLMDKPTNL